MVTFRNNGKQNPAYEQPTRTSNFGSGCGPFVRRRNGGDAIWALLNLELWHRTFIDGAGTQTLPALRPQERMGALADGPLGV